MHIFTPIDLYNISIYTNRQVCYNTDMVEEAIQNTRHHYAISRRGGSAMAISKAQQKAVNKYVRENYDRVNVNMPKGKKEKIQEQAALCGMSVNAFINAAIDEKLSRDAEATE